MAGLDVRDDGGGDGSRGDGRRQIGQGRGAGGGVVRDNLGDSRVDRAQCRGRLRGEEVKE